MVTRSPALRQVRANSGITFRPDANTVLWLPGQDDPQSSTIRDRSGKGNDGTLVGTTWAQNSKGFWVQSFDGADDVTTVSAAASINNLFDGGGTSICWMNALSDGEGDNGRAIDKGSVAGWTTLVRGEAGGLLFFRLVVKFSDIDGSWTTSARDIAIDADTFMAVTYDSGATTNNPIVYINESILTIGDGLTENQTPIGIRLDDSAEALRLGNRDSGANTFDGTIGHVILESRIMSGSEIDNIRRNAQRLFAE